MICIYNIVFHYFHPFEPACIPQLELLQRLKNRLPSAPSSSNDTIAITIIIIRIAQNCSSSSHFVLFTEAKVILCKNLLDEKDTNQMKSVWKGRFLKMTTLEAWHSKDLELFTHHHFSSDWTGSPAFFELVRQMYKLVRNGNKLCRKIYFTQQA
jgi:hypothetical protein